MSSTEVPPHSKHTPNFDEVLEETRRPLRLVLAAIRALANETLSAPVLVLSESDDFCTDLWNTLEDAVSDLGELQELHDRILGDAVTSHQLSGFRAASHFYLGADVAKAITDEEILTIRRDLLGTLYPSGQEKERPLGAVHETAVHLTRVLDRRMRSPEAWGLLERARTNLRHAVEKEEKLRAKPSITERIREAKAEREAAEISSEQHDEGEVAGVAAEGKAATD